MHAVIPPDAAPAMPEAVVGLAERALTRWSAMAEASARLINSAENLTFLAETADGARAVLRLHRQGYHELDAIRSELSWSAALGASGTVQTPAALPGDDGDLVQVVEGRFFVLFEFVEGTEPAPDDDLAASFHDLGQIAARTHLHSIGWTRPAGFTRMSWDLDAVFGADPIWGHWREGPNVDAAEAAVLSRAEAAVQDRLREYGQVSARYGLIHADMRLANLLIDQGQTRLIDFDDCGFGWFLYDFAAAISFMETHRQVPALKAAWLDGYQAIRPLSPDDLEEVDSFIMLRRLALLGWIGSRIEATEPQALAPHFAAGTAELAEAWLASGC
ncbi:MAG: phosphotransferase [Pseudomonadota bacterium]